MLSANAELSGSSPGERYLAQRHVAEALGTLGDRLAAEPQIESASRLVVDQSPYQETTQSEFGKPYARAVEQLFAEPEALVGRLQIELEDLALERRAPPAAAAIGHVTGSGAVEIEHEQRRTLPERALPPAETSPRDHALERKMRDDALIRVAPRLLISGGKRRRVLQSRWPYLDDVDGHAQSLAQSRGHRQRGRRYFPKTCCMLAPTRARLELLRQRRRRTSSADPRCSERRFDRPRLIARDQKHGVVLLSLIATVPISHLASSIRCPCSSFLTDS